MISEIVSVATDLDYWFTQFHRDTRLNDLIGEAVIVRTKVPDGGEQIKHDIIHGGILTTEIAVLDDISRAPGEALNVMLRILQVGLRVIPDIIYILMTFDTYYCFQYRLS
jgi:MoxR-like ATPase